ncbi:hypothetical protein JOD63_002823 [Microbacterium terrae]|uniref:ABC-2 family transporter protein n=1 Tax=Microbacterium terrae TaxID=69369 RepID=A0A0M2H2Q0_9MICO|nr:hypothetical protein [Microbacterium terrae]KJL38502.1 hypothetical protein RS81_02776 [Microbacterium terrae]MBP1078855.1 hypothetical protein [Microbacterium terrae]GLJ98255.1 hypothetical protein GCM10017594_14520 [Microbacterium terrae]
MSRTLNVVRMQLVNRQTYIWVPLLVLAGSFLLSLAIYALIPTDEAKYGGGAQAPLWYFLAVGVQALTLTFPFSQAMSVTRREFYLGTLLTAAMTSGILAVIFTVGGLIEEATGGWGMNGWFFRLDWIWGSGPLAALVFYFISAMLFFIVGFWSATIYKRFGSLILTAALVGLGVVLVGVVFLITWLEVWPQVWTWLVTQGPVGFTGWMTLIAAVLAAGSFTTLRRAVP